MNGLTQVTGATLAALVVLAGCGSGGGSEYKAQEPQPVQEMAIAAGEEAKVLPIKVGNTWVYEAEGQQTTPQGNQSSTSEVTFRIVDVKDSPDGKVVTFEVLSENNVTDRLKWRVSEKGIYQYSGSIRQTADAPLQEVVNNPPVRVMPFPAKAGDKLKMAVNGIRPATKPGQFNAENTIFGIQEVDTAMGRMKALCTGTEAIYTEGKVQFRSSSTTWWAKDVGMVRYRQEVLAVNEDGRQITQTTTLRLKSYTL